MYNQELDKAIIKGINKAIKLEAEQDVICEAHDYDSYEYQNAIRESYYQLGMRHGLNRAQWQIALAG